MKKGCPQAVLLAETLTLLLGVQACMVMMAAPLLDGIMGPGKDNQAAGSSPPDSGGYAFTPGNPDPGVQAGVYPAPGTPNAGPSNPDFSAPPTPPAAYDPSGVNRGK